jgi:hypothetical protein
VVLAVAAPRIGGARSPAAVPLWQRSTHQHWPLVQSQGPEVRADHAGAICESCTALVVQHAARAARAAAPTHAPHSQLCFRRLAKSLERKVTAGAWIARGRPRMVFFARTASHEALRSGAACLR